MKRISLILVVVFFISACSMLSIGGQKPTPTVAPSAVPQVTATEVVVPTLAPLPTNTAEPLPTAVLATDTQTAPANTPTPEAEAWRIPPMPGAVFVANEKKSDPEYDSVMTAQARNLAIQTPYYWDIYSIAAGTRYLVIKNYFVPEIAQTGFSLSLDVQGAGEVYLMTFIKKQTKSKIFVQFNASTAQRKTAAILIFYSNP
jgi:hypothetical protein